MGIGDIESGIQPAKVKEVKDRFQQTIQDRCGNCWALRMCGGCFAVQAENADLETWEFPVPGSVCDAVRQSKESILQMMAGVLDARRMPVDFGQNGCHLKGYTGFPARENIFKKKLNFGASKSLWLTIYIVVD